MGSFSEVVLGFDLKEDTPAEVLAAFSALATPTPPGGHDWSPPVPLPDPVVEPVPGWWPDLEIDDPYAATPWRHDWSVVVNNAMDFQTTPYARLTWAETSRWNLSCRFSMKSTPEGVFEMLTWLGPFVDVDDDHSRDYPTLLGYIHHEYAPRPHLLWCRAGVLELEDTNPDDEWEWGSPTPNRLAVIPERALTRFTVVQGLPGSGKSRYLRELAAEHPDWAIFDDFQGAAVDDDPHPMNSRYFGAVVRALRDGRPTVVADVRYCIPQEAQALALEVLAVAPGQWFMTSFEKDVDACRRNLAARAEAEAGHDLDAEMARLEAYAAHYVTMGTSRPVWTP